MYNLRHKHPNYGFGGHIKAMVSDGVSYWPLDIDPIVPYKRRRYVYDYQREDKRAAAILAITHSMGRTVLFDDKTQRFVFC